MEKQSKKKAIITINGLPGSGKSSTADGVARELDFSRFSSGDFMRKIAIDMGITLNELSSVAEKDDSIDTAIDNEVKKAGEMTDVVIDSRLAFHWIPESFKVYLSLPPQVAKERVINSLKDNELRKKSESSGTPEEAYEKIIHRLESEKKRYMELYGVDHTNKENFDLVIDTHANNLDQVISKVITEYKKWLEN